MAKKHNIWSALSVSQSDQICGVVAGLDQKLCERVSYLLTAESAMEPLLSQHGATEKSPIYTQAPIMSVNH